MEVELPPLDACPVCGRAAAQLRHCKQVCPSCGYTESCEDLFRPGFAGLPQTPHAAGDPFPRSR
jgi:hypothetical protein